MPATIPTGEATDSDFGAFAEAQKDRAVQHYTAMAAEASAMFKVLDGQKYRAQFDRWGRLEGGADVRISRESTAIALQFVSGPHSCMSQWLTPEEARAIGAQLIAAGSVQ
jgi:hypothetical protein